MLGESFETVQKRKATNLERYGDEFPSRTEDVKLKIQKTCIEKYGAPNFSQSEYFKNTPKKFKYYLDETFFDSSWEVAFYLYHKSLGHSVIREPLKIEFTFNGSTHCYFPDFEVDGQLYEIKGDQFFKEDGTMQNPYNHSLDELLEAKHQCGLINNVKYLNGHDMKPILLYVKSHFGRDFLKSLLISK